jgi:hypothetical protein
VKSRSVVEEAQRGDDLNILMAVMFEGAVEIPFGFRETQCFDLCGWAGERSSGFNELVAKLRAMVERRRRGPCYAARPWNEHSFDHQSRPRRNSRSSPAPSVSLEKCWPKIVRSRDTRSTADGEMFQRLSSIGWMLTADSEVIATMLTAGRTEAARDRIREGREKLRHLRKQLTAAMDELLEAQRVLGYAGHSGS